MSSFGPFLRCAIPTSPVERSLGFLGNAGPAKGACPAAFGAGPERSPLRLGFPWAGTMWLGRNGGLGAPFAQARPIG